VCHQRDPSGPVQSVRTFEERRVWLVKPRASGRPEGSSDGKTPQEITKLNQVIQIDEGEDARASGRSGWRHGGGDAKRHGRRGSGSAVPGPSASRPPRIIAQVFTRGRCMPKWAKSGAADGVKVRRNKSLRSCILRE